MLTSKAPHETISLPHEPGSWISIRKLSGSALRNARAVGSNQVFASMRQMGGEVVQAMQSIQTGGARAAEAEEVRAAQQGDPLNGYDIPTLLKFGLVGWSYYEGQPKSEDIDDLDGETQEYVARQLVPPVKTEEERGNGFASSPPTSTARWNGAETADSLTG